MSDKIELLSMKGQTKTAAVDGDGISLNEKGRHLSSSMSGVVDVFPAPSEAGATSLSSDSAHGYSLHQAARDGATEAVRDLIKQYLEEGFDYLQRIIDLIDSEGSAPLHHAARYNNKEIVEDLVNNKAYVDIKGEDDNTPLHLAAKYNSVDCAKVLIQKCAEINVTNLYGSTPLHFSTRRGNTDISTLLINQTGIDVNAKDNGDVTPLHQAAVSGDTLVVELLISNGADINAEDNEGEGPLHFAAEEGNADVINLLVNSALKGVSTEDLKERRNDYVNKVTVELDTALHLACQGGYEAAVEALIENGADVNAQSDTLNTPLHLAAIGGHLGVAQRLLLHGARMNARDNVQMTPLHKASLYGRTEMLSFLIDRGAKINVKDEDGYTPLLCAVWKGQTEAAEFLINKKAKLHLSDSNMKTCVHIAVESTQSDTLEMLLENGAAGLVNVADKDYKTPMHFAAQTGQLRAIEILLGKGGKADSGGNDERTPLHLAAANGKSQSVRLLGKAAPSILNSTDERGRTPLHLAALQGHFKVVMALLDLGAEIDGRDDVFWTPLDYAARYGFYKTLGMLLSNDAPVDASDKNKNTPLHLASANGHVECVNLLLDYDAQISHRNIDGKNCLDLAVENFERDVCMALVTHKRWKEAMDNTDVNGRQPMEKLIEVAPEVALVVLDKSLETSKHPVYHEDYEMTYNFKYLELPPRKNRGKELVYFGPRKMVQFKREKLLSHPVTRKLIDVKWNYIGRIPYFLNLSTYLLFVGLLTAFAIIEREEFTKDELAKLKPNSTSVSRTKTTSAFTDVVPWLACAVCLLNFIKELFQLATLRLKYFADVNNLLELFLYVSTFLFMVPFIRSITGYEPLLSDELRWSAGGISILFAWVNLLLFLQRFPYFGLYVVMFVEVLKTVLKVLSVFAIFIIAFALAFHLLMVHQSTFSTAGLSFMKVLVMTIGELEYDDVFTNARTGKSPQGLPLLPYKPITYIIFAGFLILMPIIIMNLLVGLAVGDIEAVRKSAYVRILEQQVDIIKDLESIYPQFVLDRFYKSMYVYYPNALPWYEKIRQFLGFSDQQFEFLKKDESESAGREEEIQLQLESNEEEMMKQKKRIKQLTAMVEDQGELLRQMASKMGISTDQEA